MNILTRLWNDFCESFLLMHDVTWNYVTPRWRFVTVLLWLFFPIVFLMAVIVSRGVNDCRCEKAQLIRVGYGGEYVRHCPTCNQTSDVVQR